MESTSPSISITRINPFSTMGSGVTGLGMSFWCIIQSWRRYHPKLKTVYSNDTPMDKMDVKIKHQITLVSGNPIQKWICNPRKGFDLRPCCGTKAKVLPQETAITVAIHWWAIQRLVNWYMSYRVQLLVTSSQILCNLISYVSNLSIPVVFYCTVP